VLDSHDAIRRLFRLLSALELNAWPSWDGPIEVASLRSRTQLLATRFGFVRDQYSGVQLDQVAVFLAKQLRSERDLRVESLGQTMRVLLQDRPPFHPETRGGGIADQAGLDAQNSLARWARHLQASSFCEDSLSCEGFHAGESLRNSPIQRLGKTLRRAAAFSAFNNRTTCRSEHRLSLVAAIAQTSKVCLVVGPPGFGKTSLVSGFMRAVLNEEIEGYEVPLWIDGDEYARALLLDASLSPLDYFFTQWGQEGNDSKLAAQAFRDRPHTDKQSLLIIDGWDRIPAHNQKLAWSHLARDACHTKVLLTSRPGGGMLGNPQLQRFELCEVQPEEIRAKFQQIVHWQGSHSMADDALEQIRLHDESNSLLVNPYWQSLIATYVLGHGAGKPFNRLTRLVQQLITWELERTRTQTASGLTMGHLRMLGELAFSSIRNPHSHENSFMQYDCERVAYSHQVSADEVFASRLVYRCSEVTDEYQFSSEVFRSYLAAQYLVENQSAEQQREFFDLAMTCSRLLPTVLHAVAIDDGFRRHTKVWIAEWMLRLDHFEVLTQRLAQVVIATAWDPADLDGPIPELNMRLWNAIGKSQNEQGTKRLMQLLASLDPEFLRRKMTGLRSSNPVLSSELMRHVPNSFHPNQLVVSASSIQSPYERSGDAEIPSDLTNPNLFGVSDNLSRIAALPPEHPEVAQRLITLVDTTIDGDIGFLLDVGGCASVEPTVRSLAINVLSQATCPIAPLTITRLMETESDPANVNALIRLAVKHSVPLDTDLIVDALRRHDHERLELLWECLDSTQKHEIRPSLDERVDSAVAYQLIHFTSCLQVGNWEHADIVPLMRAVAKFASLSMNEAGVIHLCDALEITLSKAAEQRGKGSSDFNQLSEGFALAIAARDPAVLLNRFWEHTLVQTSLSEFARQHGWLIYRDRIVNDNGVVIARNAADPLMHLRYSTPDIIQEIAKTLSPRQRNDFLSYWHMVSEGDCDFHQSDRETIHQSMCTILRSELNDSLSERLLSCYQDGEPPQFTTWKKNLNRVVNRCASRPDWMAHLLKIGLGSQTPASSEATWQRKPR
jgi:hypothetical protein